MLLRLQLMPSVVQGVCSLRSETLPYAGSCFCVRVRWSSSNITLLGDACHPATPNNGQGACMAIEDAFVLATLLAEYWDKPDGHVEAFYLYEVRQ